MDGLENVARWVNELPPDGHHDENVAALVPGFRQSDAWRTVIELLPRLADSVRLPAGRVLTLSLVLEEVSDAGAPWPMLETDIAASASDWYPPTVVVGPSEVRWSFLWQFERHTTSLPRGSFGSDDRYVLTLDRSRADGDEPLMQRLQFHLVADDG